MRILALVAAFALTAAADPPAPARQATPTLSIAPGETVTVRIAGTPAGFVELSRARPEASEDRAEDTVRFTFGDIGGMMILHVENGYAQGFNYRAQMVVGRRSARTSTCTVMPRIIVVESWPYRIDRLELSEPRLSDGGEMSCR